MKHPRLLWFSFAVCAASLLSACHNNNNGFQANTPENPPMIASSTAAPATPVAPVQPENIQTTASGLQYSITKAGSGKTPKADDMVTVKYIGRLPDGTVFDSTDKHGGQPVSFALNQVIAGWTEGLQLVQEGGAVTLFIPPELGYGERGVPGAIPPNSPLIFEVELLKVGN
ncbi:FKBP-type peptidyl-prolyl cis-trans isomerase [Stenoxybacter acetivorans]|uniref:FKBP-type peptidyl-prolyl cis-trans isomerase n=1 Tax=Stenoxybacter acetivorans TaxID=422441 RepID=UPI00068FF377|nr:FKBP-type peptidyl-prolyl cis-trans isomerase [Stenoxybacter acetivorans]